MTLVAGLSIGGLPAFVSDLLVSWRIPMAVDLPTQDEVGVRPGIGTDHAAGLAQKLVIIRPYLMIAWAGQRAEADRMIQELDIGLPLKASELHSPNTIFEILNTCRENTEVVALLIWGDAIYPFGVRTRGFELDGRWIYLLGSGAPDFFEYLEAHPDVLPRQDQADGLIARAFMLRFAANALVWQSKIGFGLANSWGGGFEVAYPHPKGFRKIGDVLFRAWLIDEERRCFNSGRSFFLRYYDQYLYLSCFNPGANTYIVPSPVGDKPEIPETEEIHPLWTLDVFVMKENGWSIEFARYQPPDRPAADMVELANGALVGWSMDQHHVEECAKKAIKVAGTRNRFEITRY